MNNTAIHSYCWVPFWSTEHGQKAVERAARAGYGHVVVPLRDPSAIDAGAIARMFEQAGLKPLTTANQLPDADISSTDPEIRRRGIERHRNAMKLARDLGSDHVGGIVYGVFGKASRAANVENFKAAADSLAILAGDAKEAGLRIALEIVNRYESSLINTVDQGLEMLELVGADNVYLHLDTFHMNIEEPDLLAALRRALPRTVYFELDQNNRGRLDQGTIDFRPLLAALKEADFRGLIGVEAFSSAISGPDVAAGVASWRNLFDDGDEVAETGMAILRQSGWVR
jgi:D-psicose/D-tagatose/L-ribulose 3-epimerase